MRSYIYLIFLTILVSGCTSVNKSDGTKRLDLEKLTHELFSEYNYEYDTNRTKKNTKLIVVVVSKKDFTPEDYEKIKTKLIKQKWINIDNFNNYYSFCNTDNYFIGILDPKYSKHYTRDGSEITFDNMNNWYFAFYYNSFGINSCEEYLKK